MFFQSKRHNYRYLCTNVGCREKKYSSVVAKKQQLSLVTKYLLLPSLVCSWKNKHELHEVFHAFVCVLSVDQLPCCWFNKLPAVSEDHELNSIWTARFYAQQTQNLSLFFSSVDPQLVLQFFLSSALSPNPHLPACCYRDSRATAWLWDASPSFVLFVADKITVFNAFISLLMAA